MTTTALVTTRVAGPADAAFLRTLFVASLPPGVAALGAVPGLLELQHEGRERSYAAAYPDRDDLVVEVAGEPVGRLQTATGPSGTHVVDIALLPAHRGRGLGGTLLRDLVARGPVTLSVAVGNPALRLYERLGFIPIGATATDLSLHHPGDRPDPARLDEGPSA